MSEEIKRLIQDQGNAFAEYKKTMEQQIAELKKGGVSGETQDKLNKILADYDEKKEAMDRTFAEMQALRFNPGTQEDPKLKAHKEAFDVFARKGDTSKIMNVVQVGVDADGGYACPPDISSRIITAVAAGNPIRQLATVETITRSGMEFFTDPNDMTAIETTEAGTRSETATPGIGKITINPIEMYCYPKATQASLDDAIWNFENWLIGKAGFAFAALERARFATGNGVTQSQGITMVDTVADANWAWKKLGFITTGQASAISTDGADLVSIVDALEDAYKANASWVFNKAAFTSYRKLRAGTSGANQFLFWTPSLQAGVPDKFADYPVYKSSDMPSVAANALIAAFGDFKVGYTIVDRMGMNVIRDNVTAPGFVKFHIYRRSKGQVTNFQAIKLLKVAA